VNQEWDVAANDWKNKTQELYTYDSHNLLTEDLVRNWASSGSAWENSRKSVYYYSEFNSVNEHPGNERLCFYSNPLIKGTSVNCPGLSPSGNYVFELYSMMGEKVYQAAVNGNAPFMISPDAASGTYILRITADGKTVFRDKVVIIQ